MYLPCARLLATAAIPAALMLTSPAAAASPATPAAAAAPSAERGEIVIHRDKWGVPHVFADTSFDLFYGAAYALAQDRLAQYELTTRTGLGRLAEIAGPAAVEQDKYIRRFVATDAELEVQFAKLDREQQEILRGTYEGWIAHIREARRDPSKTPYEYKLWGIEPTEFTFNEFLNSKIAVVRLFGANGGMELTNLKFYNDLVQRHGEAKAKEIFDDVLPLQDPDAVPFIPEKGRTTIPAHPKLFAAQTALPLSTAFARPLPARRGASRALLISARKSASGHPMILQATADGPDVHLSGAGYEAAGYVQGLGAPIAQGRTRTFAWSITTGEADLIDIFAEKLNPANSRQYFHKGAWRDMEVRREVIRVRGAEPVVFETEHTVHGPVIHREDAAHVAYASSMVLAGRDLAGFAGGMELNRARTFEDYKRAASLFVGSFNINYAGTDGRIATVHAGLRPIRAKGVDPRLPTPGTGEYDWQGFETQLSMTVDPEQGYLHVWNNKPTEDTTYGDTSRYGKSFRTWLGRDLVEAKEKVSREDLHEIHRKIGRSSGGVDLTVTNPRFFTPYLKTAVAGDARLEAVVAAMENWNALYEDADKDGLYDHPGLPAYRTWVEIAQASIIGDDIGDWWRKIDEEKYIKYRTDVLLRAIQGKDAGAPMKHDWFNGKPRSEVLRQTVADTLATLEKTYGSAEPKAWRQTIFYRYYNPEAAEQNPDKPSRTIDRTSLTVSAAARLGLQPAYVTDNGSEDWNMLVEVRPDDPTLYDATLQGGQNLFVSQDGKGNPNVADQVRLHEAFEFKAVSMDHDTIIRDAVSTIRLKAPARRQAN